MVKQNIIKNLKAFAKFLFIKISFLIEKIAKITNISRKELSIITIAILVTVLTLFVYFPKDKQDTNQTKNQTKTTSQAGTLTKGTPNYKTLLPAGKTIIQLGGWTRVSPSNSNPVYAFVDKIGDIPINVSQQPLPDNFKSDTNEQIASLAADFRAEEKITIGSTTVYLGTSAKGPQSAIFTKNNLLILIKSSVKINNDKWSSYINSLQ